MDGRGSSQTLSHRLYRFPSSVSITKRLHSCTPFPQYIACVVTSSFVCMTYQGPCALSGPSLCFCGQAISIEAVSDDNLVERTIVWEHLVPASLKQRCVKDAVILEREDLSGEEVAWLERASTRDVALIMHAGFLVPTVILPVDL